MNNYCIAGSPSIEFQCENDINLQLYSLQKAAENWNELIYSIKQRTQSGDVNLRKEKLVFVLNCLGISLSQLLGQNSPSPDNVRIDDPRKALRKILSENKIDGEKRDLILDQFAEFVKYYDTGRHFGLNKDRQKYRIIDQLTLEKLDHFRCTAITICDIINKLFENGKNKSVSELVYFADLSYIHKA